MPSNKYLYSFNYDIHNSNLSKLVSRQIFKEEEKDKVLLSNKRVDLLISPFIKNRIEIIAVSENYSELIHKIKAEKIKIEAFNVEYVIIEGDSTEFSKRKEKLKKIGFSIEGNPNFKSPKITYSICFYNNTWYFGVLSKHNVNWYKHKKKPHSFSNSIGMDIAKTLVSIASKENKSNKLLDVCCGVGTIMLEACASGFSIDGCDINPKRCEQTNKNLDFYGYSSSVYSSDIKDLNKKYDAAIIDLPYNMYSYSTDLTTANIIESTAKLANRVIIVSIADIESIIKKAGLVIQDYGTAEKRGKSGFVRNIWVCVKSEIQA